MLAPPKRCSSKSSKGKSTSSSARASEARSNNSRKRVGEKPKTKRGESEMARKELSRADFLKKTGAAAAALTAAAASLQSLTGARGMGRVTGSAVVQPPIAPSGDTTGVADANAIEAALRAAGPGDTVQLAAGTFYCSREIIVENFSGTFRGQGKTS